MNTHTKPTVRPSHTRARLLAVVIATSGVALTAGACSGNLHHTYGTFKSALDRGASCAELFDQRARFDDDETLAKIDRDLTRIGCTSRTAARTD